MGSGLAQAAWQESKNQPPWCVTGDGVGCTPSLTTLPVLQIRAGPLTINNGNLWVTTGGGSGNLYVDKKIGIGFGPGANVSALDSTAALDVDGQIKIRYGAGSNKVMVSDDSGLGRWQNLGITSLTEGTGIDLNPNTIVDSGQIAVDTGVIQRLVTQSCSSPEVISGIDAVGGVSCVPGGSGISSLSQSNGIILTLDSTTNTLTIGTDHSTSIPYTQGRVTNTCGIANAMWKVNANQFIGGVCRSFITSGQTSGSSSGLAVTTSGSAITVALKIASIGGLSFGAGNSVKVMSCGNDQYLKAITSGWSCASPSLPDTILPTVSITQPLAGQTLSGTGVIVRADASDNVGVVGVQFKLDGANLGTEDITSGDGWSTIWNTQTTIPGSHTLTAVARDARGNIATSIGVVVNVVDQTVPTVILVTPSNGSTVSGTISVTATASDNIGINRVIFYLDTFTVIGVDTVSPYGVNWNTSTVTNGPHTLRAMVEDTSGNLGYSPLINITVSNQYSLNTLTAGTGSGTIDKSPNQATYSPGSAVTLTAIASVGSVFTGWSGGLTGSTNPVSITINGNTTVTANFTIQTWTSNASVSPVAPPGSGTISPSGTISTNYGVSRGFTVDASPGHRISSVRINGTFQTPIPSGCNNQLFYNVDDNPSYTPDTIVVNFQVFSGCP